MKEDTLMTYYGNYDSTALKFLPFYAEMHTEIIERINKRPDDKIKVLELGFGTGNLTERIFTSFPNVVITGLDNYQKNVDQALIKLRGYNFNSKVQSFKDMSGLNDRFDFVVSSLAIHHLSATEKRDLFARVYEVLPRGGRFIIGDIVKSDKEKAWHNYLVENMGEEGEERWQTHKNNKDDKPSTLDRQILWLKQAGFEKVEVTAGWYNFNVFFGEKC